MSLRVSIFPGNDDDDDFTVRATYHNSDANMDPISTEMRFRRDSKLSDVYPAMMDKIKHEVGETLVLKEILHGD